MFKFNRILFLVLFALCGYNGISQKYAGKPVIFDSDMGPDYDDAGAITMLHAYADSGYIKILATVASTNYEGVAAVLNVFNIYFKKPSIPIGVPKKNGLMLKDWQHWTDSLIKNYPHAINYNSEVPDATEVYRKILSGQKNNSVTIVTVGFFTNLSNLLKSKGDQYSALTGLQLVNQKVKQLICMAGKFPAGKEFNVEKDAAASQFVFSHWKGSVIFSGFEIGDKIKAGLQLVANNNIKDSPVKDVFRISIPLAAEDSSGRKSWDETAVMVAAKGYKDFYNLKKGSIIINKDGSNSWNDKGTMQGYLIEKVPADIVSDYINKMIQHQPKIR